MTIRSDDLLCARRLEPGATLAAVTLSAALPELFPHRYEAGKRQLEETFGVRVVEMTHTLADQAFLTAHPEARAEDLMAAFADPEIDGIVASIGGDDSIRILRHLDLDVIRDNPKVFCGYSDTTISHAACLRAGLVSFYGPAIMSGFAENAGIPAYLEEGVRRMMFSSEPPGVWPENDEGWTVEFSDWSDPANQNQVRQRHQSTGWRWLQGTTPVEGPLIAGCFEVMDWLRGTEWWPDLEGVVLALETSEEAPPPLALERFLRSLAAAGELNRIRGLLLGRPGGSDLAVDAHVDYDRAVLRVLGEEGLDNLIVVTGMDFGHTDPMWTLPIGVRTIIDPQQLTVSFPDPATH